MYVLLIDYTADYEAPDVHGPFATVAEAQKYARHYRKDRSIPGCENDEPTDEENEAWTNADWYFGIFELIADPRLEND